MARLRWLAGVATLLLLLRSLAAAAPSEEPSPLLPPFAADSGHAWTAPAPPEWAADGEGRDASRLILLEDGVPLGPAHALHDDIRRFGGGRYSHWKGLLYFSTRDGSDPNRNGRAYAVVRDRPPGAGQDLWPGPRAGLSPAFPAAAEAPVRWGSPRADAPRIVWIFVIDALRPDTAALRLDDGPLMPALARLAESSVRFERAYAASSFTKTSTASLFTGLWPGRHGVLHGVVPTWPEGVALTFDLDRRFLTLAEAAAALGYETWTHPYTVHVRPGDGMLQGFSRLDLAAGRNPPLAALPERLFVYEHVLGVHGPYDPSPEARARLGLPPRGAPRVEGAVDPGSTEWFEAELDEAAVAALRAAYHGEAVDADAVLAARIAWLQERGLWDETLLVVTADHGEAFLEHGSTQHSVQLYEEAVAVPLLLHFPAGHPLAVHHGGSRPQRVSLVDLLPTFLELLAEPGIRLPYPLDGQSLLPLLDEPGADLLARDVLLRASFTRTVEGSERTALFATDAILSGGWKAHVGWRLQSSQAPLAPFRQGEWIAELYDLRADPGETTNLAPERPADFLALVRRIAAAAGPLSLQAGADPGDAERALRQLGYLR